LDVNPFVEAILLGGGATNSQLEALMVVVPEPGTGLLVGIAGLWMGATRRRRG